jgi:hypothetical protein
MPSEFEGEGAGEYVAAHRAARLHYELGRLASAARHAGLVTAAVALVAGITLGRRALVLLPLTLVVVLLTEWRGAYLMKGARRGVVAGVASLLVPLSVLRPCCAMDAKAMGTTCCTMPSACWGAGAVVGLVMALLVPAAPEGRRMEAALGMILGVTCVALVRCSALFLGETAGLLGGMAAGVIATSLARAWMERARTRPMT